MSTDFSNAELEAFLDESLPVERMAEIEAVMRDNEQLQQRVTAINGRRDAGVHSLGEIWRRHRLSCPSRQQLGSYLLGVLPTDVTDYVKFHLETIVCRYCTASLEDLRSEQSAADAEGAQRRRHRYFQSSIGHLHRDE